MTKTPSYIEARDIAVDTQGRLTIAGVARYWSDDRFAYVGRTFTRRYTSTLDLDTSFNIYAGNDGGIDTVARAIAVRSNNGAIVAADSTVFSLAYDQWGVVYRTTPTGALDFSFSGNGYKRVNISKNLEMRYNDVAVTTTGSELVFAAGRAEIDPSDPPP